MSVKGGEKEARMAKGDKQGDTQGDTQGDKQDAAGDLAGAFGESYRTVVQSAVDAQQRNVGLAQHWVESLTGLLESPAETHRAPPRAGGPCLAAGRAERRGRPAAQRRARPALGREPDGALGEPGRDEPGSDPGDG